MKKLFATALVAAMAASVSSGVMAQSSTRGITEWVTNDCKRDPFKDRSIDCYMFILESGADAPPREQRALAIVRVASSSNGREFMVLQFRSDRHPPLLSGDAPSKELLLRIDQGTVRTLQPKDVIIIKNSDGGTFQTIEMDEGLVREMVAGKGMFVRYTARGGNIVTQQYSLGGVGEALFKITSEYERLSGKPSQ